MPAKTAWRNQLRQNCTDIASKLKIAGCTYLDISIALGIDETTVCKYLNPRKNAKRNQISRCENCRKRWPSLHVHHTNHKTNSFKRLCSRCHGRFHGGKPLAGKHVSQNELNSLFAMAAKLKADRHGQMIAVDLMPLTPMQEAEHKILTAEYHKNKGNISLTARRIGWSRSKTLEMLRKWKLYDLYPHEPGPFTKEK